MTWRVTPASFLNEALSIHIFNISKVFISLKARKGKFAWSGPVKRLHLKELISIGRVTPTSFYE